MAQLVFSVIMGRFTRIAYYAYREAVEVGIIGVAKQRTKNNLVDLFFKVLMA